MPVGLPIFLWRTIVLGMALGSLNRDGLEVGVGLQPAELLLHQGQRFVGIDVAEDGDDHVVRHEVLRVIVAQILRP